MRKVITGALELERAAKKIGSSLEAAPTLYLADEADADLLASVAAQGFRELAAALRAATDAPEPMVAVGFAYLDFAMASPGVFGLMFGPFLARKEHRSNLTATAAGVYKCLARSGALGKEPRARRSRALAAWSLIHGFATLIIADYIPAENAKRLMRDTLAEADRARD